MTDKSAFRPSRKDRVRIAFAYIASAMMVLIVFQVAAMPAAASGVQLVLMI